MTAYHFAFIYVGTEVGDVGTEAFHAEKGQSARGFRGQKSD